MKTELHIAYKLFPYEARFLRREVEALGGSVVQQLGHRLVATNLPPKAAVRLTYATWFVNGTPRPIATLQSQRESAGRRAQDTRFGPHGLHDYRGKFNPQTPRSLLLQNYRRWKRGLPVLDPFCGSGTTLIEARHLGLPSEGVEKNPLANLVTEAKLDWERKPAIAPPRISIIQQAKRAGFLPSSRVYLRKWFPEDTLCEIESVMGYTSALSLHERRIALVLLSNLLRGYSWQDPKDLRIRRRDTIPEQPSLTSTFANRLQTSLEERSRWSGARHTRLRVMARAFCGDSRRLQAIRGDGRIAGTVCSPPYASALPYVDTYRLSLVTLGLTEPREVLPLEYSILGSRDVERQDKESFHDRLDRLPLDCRAFVQDLEAQVRQDRTAGFRKRNVPYALARYLTGLLDVLDQLRRLEGKGAPNLWVVGPNRTTIKGRLVAIPTPQLIGALAQHAGFNGVSYEPLEAYSRFDIHSKNSIRTETLVSFDG